MYITLGVYSVGLDKCIVTHSHNCGIMQNRFTALKILSDLPVISSSSLTALYLLGGVNVKRHIWVLVITFFMLPFLKYI